MEQGPKRYRMLASSPGVREGDVYPTAYRKGEIYELDASLAEQFYHLGMIEEVAGHPADGRSTKVTGPKETKADDKEGEAGVPLSTQNIEELVTVARDKYGLEVDSTMGEDEIRKLIEDAQGGEAEARPHDLKKLSKVDLVTYAKTELGLDLVPDTMTKAAMIEAIEAHSA